MRAEVVHMRLFDLGAEVDLARVTSLRGQAPRPAPVVAHSPVPPSTSFPQPIEAVLETQGASVPGATMEVRLHALGVLTVRFRWRCETERVGDLRDEAARFRVGNQDVEAAAEEVFQEVRAEVAGALQEPYGTRVAPERYVAYCIHAPPPDVPRILQEERDRLAELISDARAGELVPARVVAAGKHALQYTPGDAVLVGWDHAVILDEPGEYEDILDVMELANLELLEFRTYDAYLDRRLESSFAALDRLWARGGLFRSARSALQEISRLRVEFARLTDNLHDTGKVFGDWYTAQLHRHLHDRFHLASWERAVATKMDTLEDMFHLAQEEANHRRSLVLEVLIVLLFILDLWIIVRVGG